MTIPPASMATCCWTRDISILPFRQQPVHLRCRKGIPKQSIILSPTETATFNALITKVPVNFNRIGASSGTFAGIQRERYTAGEQVANYELTYRIRKNRSNPSVSRSNDARKYRVCRDGTYCSSIAVPQRKQ